MRAWIGRQRLSIVGFAAILLGMLGASGAVAAGDTWFQTGNYARVDNYNTDFYAQGASWWDPVNSSNIYVWRTYLRMDITDSELLNCDRNYVTSAGFSETKLSYNAPFPLYYSNTPAWDYWTWDRNHGFTYTSTFGASRDEQCNSINNVKGAWWSKSSTTGWSYGAW